MYISLFDVCDVTHVDEDLRFLNEYEYSHCSLQLHAEHHCEALVLRAALGTKLASWMRICATSTDFDPMCTCTCLTQACVMNGRLSCAL